MASAPRVPSLGAPTHDLFTIAHADDKDSRETASSTPSINPQTCSPLFRLSPELRNSIYELVLDRKDRKDLEKHGIQTHKVDLHTTERSAPSNELLRTCRLVFQEAKGVFFQEQRDFWSKTMFEVYLAICEEHESLLYFDSPRRLCNEQIESISRIHLTLENVSLNGEMHFELTHKDDFSPARGAWSVRPIAGLRPDYEDREGIISDLFSQKSAMLQPDQISETCAKIRRRHFAEMLREEEFHHWHGRVTTEEKEEWEEQASEEIELLEQSQRSMKRLDLMLIMSYFCSAYERVWGYDGVMRFEWESLYKVDS